MKQSEYISKIAKINREYAKQTQDVECTYAMSNSKVKIGDVVKGNVCKIRIDKIKYTVSGKFPSCVYFGVMLTKKGNKFKSGERGRVSQSEIIRLKAAS